jgi:hypothetical protein
LSHRSTDHGFPGENVQNTDRPESHASTPTSNCRRSDFSRPRLWPLEIDRTASHGRARASFHRRSIPHMTGHSASRCGGPLRGRLPSTSRNIASLIGIIRGVIASGLPERDCLSIEPGTVFSSCSLASRTLPSRSCCSFRLMRSFQTTR